MDSSKRIVATRYLRNCQRESATSTPWTRKRAEMYLDFLQKREMANDYFSNELPLACPICHENIVDIDELRIVIRKMGDNYEFCNYEPSSCHYRCSKCIFTISFDYREHDFKCQYCPGRCLYI